MSTGKSEPQLRHVDGLPLPVELRIHPRARGFRLRYDARAGHLRLSLPSVRDAGKALAWARGQQDWIARQLLSAPQTVSLVDGADFPLEGEKVRISWDPRASRTPAVDGKCLRVGGPPESVERRVLRWLKARALLALSAETHDMARGAGLRVMSVGVGDPRGRWGSCTSTGRLRYSWRLILAPADVRRAIVAHEVAHLLHMNHSAAFHAAHADLLGEDPAFARAWLRRHGTDLHRYGAQSIL